MTSQVPGSTGYSAGAMNKKYFQSGLEKKTRSGVIGKSTSEWKRESSVLYAKHHHFDDVVTQQQPACFVKIKTCHPNHRASALDVLPLWRHNSLP
jgi:hypothetical protein